MSKLKAPIAKAFLPSAPESERNDYVLCGIFQKQVDKMAFGDSWCPEILNITFRNKPISHIKANYAPNALYYN